MTQLLYIIIIHRNRFKFQPQAVTVPLLSESNVLPLYHSQMAHLHKYLSRHLSDLSAIQLEK